MLLKNYIHVHVSQHLQEYQSALLTSRTCWPPLYRNGFRSQSLCFDTLGYTLAM